VDVTENGVPGLMAELEKMRKNLAKWTDGARRMLTCKAILTIDRPPRTARQRRAQAARRRSRRLD
jgi:hypothetical protein